jgi:MoxR-like ATPase
MSMVRGDLAQAIRLLRQANVQLSDRRIVKAQHLIAAATVLAGRRVATRADLWPLVYAIPTSAGQQNAREALRDVLAEARHPLLHAVVEEAVQQPLARVARMAEAADQILAHGDAAQAGKQAEALLREIDANFDLGDLPTELAARRGRLVAAVGAA